MAALKHIGVFCLIACASPGSLNAGDDRRTHATELIRVMKADDQAMELIEKLILNRCREEKCDADLRECLLKVDRGHLTDMLVNFSIRELTSAEMEAATIYFRSETGERHRQVMRKELGLSEESLSDQSLEMRTAMLAFLDTPAGYRLVTRALLTNSDEVRWLIGSQAREAFYRCRP